jgi:hypothetical protein
MIAKNKCYPRSEAGKTSEHLLNFLSSTKLLKLLFFPSQVDIAQAQ